MGTVVTKPGSVVAGSRDVRGRVELTLYRRSGHRWQRVSPVRRAKLNGGGRFEKPLRSFQSLRPRLRSGTYRLFARYLGSRSATPSACRSARFRLLT
jgi:hypothetical protein